MVAVVVLDSAAAAAVATRFSVSPKVTAALTYSVDDPFHQELDLCNLVNSYSWPRHLLPLLLPFPVAVVVVVRWWHFVLDL